MAEPADLPNAPDEHIVSTVQSPPRSMRGILSRLGPGLIIAGSIVGSGELIATTKTGAEAGFWLLWLIIVGCMIKVFVQVEFGRFAITEGRTSLEGMDMVPGPRLRCNWLMWYWVLMFTLGFGQLGGIVGGVGQSLAMTVPLQGDFAELVRRQGDQASYDGRARELIDQLHAVDDEAMTKDEEGAFVADTLGARPEMPARLEYTYDDMYWSALVTLVTAVLLINGRYGLIQTVATLLVASFTMVTIFNVFALQSHTEWAVGWDDMRAAFSFRLPPAASDANTSPLFTAFAAFGIIGVGASELVAYPYWCLEKGYARFAGPRDASDKWRERATGWLRVMRWDAWCSMVIYTFATVAFFMLGAGVLHRAGLNPDGSQMIRVLAEMYVPVFGDWAKLVFLFGAVAVLYSTFFVATAGNSRMASDALRVFRIAATTPEAGRIWVRVFCGLFPFLSLAAYVWFRDPVTLVLVSGMAQNIMLPMLGGAALYFRYRKCDPRIAPGPAWTGFLWASCAGLLVAGVFGACKSVPQLFDQIASWVR